MNLKEYIEQLLPHHLARKEYDRLIKEVNAAFNEAAMDHRVQSNRNTIVEVQRECINYAVDLLKQSLDIHPEYEDSYPPLLKVLKIHAQSNG